MSRVRDTRSAHGLETETLEIQIFEDQADGIDD